MRDRLLYNSFMEIIYIDSLFFLNLITDYLLCLAAARICALRFRRLRYFAAALFGAAYAVAAYLPQLSFLSHPLMKLSAGIGMGLISFAPELRPLRCTAVLLAVSAAFGGALWAMSLSTGGELSGGVFSMKTLLLSFALCYAALCLLFRCRAALLDKRRVLVSLSFLGREAEFTALVDTGNSLTDPATGSPVLIACPHALQGVLRENTALFSQAEPVELMELTAALPELAGRLRLIPYTAVGSSGLLPAFRPDKLSIDGKEDKEHLIAVSQNAAGDGFEAII